MENYALVARARMSELKAVLDQLVERTEFNSGRTPDEGVLLQEVVENLKEGGASLQDEAAPFLWTCYRSMASELTADKRRACGMPEIP
jgi:hypothetical protein